LLLNTAWLPELQFPKGTDGNSHGLDEVKTALKVTTVIVGGKRRRIMLVELVIFTKEKA